MTTKLVRMAALTALLLGAAGQAQADVVTVDTSAVLNTPVGSPDSFSLNPDSNTFSITPNVPTIVGYQSGNFHVDFSPFVSQAFPFNFTEFLTINGDSEPVAFTGNILVTLAQDTLTFDPGAAQSFAGMTVQFQPLSLSVPATTAGDIPFTAEAIITTPEPATLGLLGLALGAAGLLRRRRPSA